MISIISLRNFTQPSGQATTISLSDFTQASGQATDNSASSGESGNSGNVSNSSIIEITASNETTRINYGDAAMKSDEARTNFGIDGTGITVGVLSRSYNKSTSGNPHKSASEDIASGDLPPASRINVLQDGNSIDTDMGRAMMQLIHDIAPGANLAFHTVDGGEEAFAQGIWALEAAGADVIVDGSTYLREPMFQDGKIAQAVEEVVAKGVPYFSSAGNNARRSYESAFNPSGSTETLSDLATTYEWHDFDPGAGVDITQGITIATGDTARFSFQWDQPFFSVSGGQGSLSDIDIFLAKEEDGVNEIIAGGIERNQGGDAVESFSFTNDGSHDTTSFNLLLGKNLDAGGPNPGLMKYVEFGGITIDEYDTASPTSYGHANAAGAFSVGAAAYYNTPEYGTTPPILEDFSSAGGVDILFDRAGNRLITPSSRKKVDIVAPDGTNTTFFGLDISEDVDSFPNFFGTAAAAAHGAAVAALMLEGAGGAGSLTPTEVYSALKTTAIEMGTAPYEADSGWGFIDGNAAVAVHAVKVQITATGDTVDGDTNSISNLIASPGADGEISLREAVIAANNTGADARIILSGGQIYNLTRTGTGEDAGATGDLDIVSNGEITLSTTGAGTAVINANGIDRVFDVLGNASLVLNNVEVTGGNATGSSPNNSGGGIKVNSNGTLALTNSTVRGNTASKGGGIYNNSGTARIANSTVSGNTAIGGGGIYNDGGRVSIASSTVSGNTAIGGSGIYNKDGTASIANSIIAANAGDKDLQSNGATFTSGGHNLIGYNNNITAFTNDANGDIVGTAASPVNPMLGPLQDNGGATFTQALLTGSGAINAGNNSNIPTDELDVDGDGDPAEAIDTDQRGTTRIEGGTVDIGAYEFDNTPPTVTNLASNLTTINDINVGTGTFTLVVDFSEGMNTSVSPTLAFPTAGENPTSTITFNSGSWSDRDTYVATYNVADANEIINNIDVQITGAQDVAGYSQTAETQNDVFSIYTGNSPETVTVTDDRVDAADGEISLREAVIGANNTAGDDLIILTSGQTYNLTITVTGEDAAATGDLDIVSNGKITLFTTGGGTAVINAGGIDRVFDVLDNASLALENVVVTGGNATGSFPNNIGGGIRVNSNGTLALTNSTVSGNRATFGGGINNYQGTASIANSTVSGNTAAHRGGGIDNLLGTASIANSTVSGNTANYGGGISNYRGTASIANSIIAANADNKDLNNSGTFTSGGHNLIGNNNGITAFTDGVNGDIVGTAGSPVNPMLGPLQDNGGETFTQALLTGSGAINAGNNSNIPTDELDVDGDGDTAEKIDIDQRGTTRIQEGTVDIGAYEFDNTPPVVNSIVRADSNPTNAATVDFTVTFDRPVTGVDSGDFSLNTTGVAEASITNVAGAGDSYTVTVNTGSGDGTVGLDLIDDDTIADNATNLLGGTGANNGDYTSEGSYSIDKTAPTVTVNPLATFDTTPPLTGTVNENTASIQVTVNGNSYPANNEDGTWTLADNTITPALSEGTYDVAVTATDTAGNIGNDSTSDELVVAIARVSITETSSSTSVEEGGATDTYMVVLDAQPTGDVIVNITPDPQTTVNPTSLTFTSGNWDTAQTVTVTADDDLTVENAHTSTIGNAIAPSSAAEYVGVGINNVTVNITDNDLNPITGSSGGETIEGTSGPDRITGGLGGDLLTGGGGSDEFVYTQYQDGGDTITDFAPGADKMDLSAVMDEIGYVGSDPITDGYLEFRERSGSAFVMVDIDGPDGPFRSRTLAKIEGVTLAVMNNASNFIF